MSISPNVGFEVRTTGNDSNGGGFVAGASGTDFSQQNAAQYTFSDLASSNGTSGTPQVTSASHSFVAADVGNIMQITAGTNWTTGFFQIVSVSGGAATMDRAVGSAASISGGSYAVGGALLTVQQALVGTAQCATPAQNAHGGFIWVQKGTYTVTANIDTGNGAHQSQPNISMIGYDTTHGDNTGTRPLITTATNSICLIAVFQNLQTASNIFTFDNINFSTTAGTPGGGIAAWNNAVNTGGTIIVRRSKLSGFTYAFATSEIFGGGTDYSLILVGVEITACTTRGFQVNGNTGHQCIIDGCYIHGNTGNGGGQFGTGGGQNACILVDSIFSANSGNGMNAQPAYNYCDNCAFVGNTGLSSDGLNTNGSIVTTVSNSIFYGNGNYGLNNASANVIGFNNAFGSNAAALFNPDRLVGTITLTANPFVNSAGGNFALNNTAGGGVLLTALGFPSTFGSTTTATPNVGPVQSSVGSAGGFTRSVMSGGMYG